MQTFSREATVAALQLAGEGLDAHLALVERAEPTALELDDVGSAAAHAKVELQDLRDDAMPKPVALAERAIEALLAAVASTSRGLLSSRERAQQARGLKDARRDVRHAIRVAKGQR